MILEFAVATFAVYVAAGIVAFFRGPLASNRALARKYRQGPYGLSVDLSGKVVQPIRHYALRALVFFQIAFLWPMLLVKNWLNSRALARQVTEYMQRNPYLGLTFKSMGGVGVVTCEDCKRTQEIVSFTHGDNSCCTGYQCRQCGKLEARLRKFPQLPFAEPNPDWNFSKPLESVPPQYRQAWILDKQKNLDHVEHLLRKKQSSGLKKRLKADLAKYREMLSHVPKEEQDLVSAILDRFKAACSAASDAYNATLFCECGGPLDRDAVLFCPGCRSKRLSYKMTYIT